MIIHKVYNALVFTHSSQLGGAERNLIEFIRVLSKEFHIRCTVVLPFDGPSVKLLGEAGANTVIAPISWWCTDASSTISNEIHHLNADSFSWIIENLNWLRNLDPDLIITNTLVIPWGALIAALIKRPHIWLVQEFGEADHGFKFIHPFCQVVDFIEKSSERIVTCSNAIQQKVFPGLDEAEIQTIYTPIHFPENENQNFDFDHNIFDNPTASHLIITGTLTETKGQEDAVRSVIELVKNRQLPVELVIVGYHQPDYFQHLQEIISREDMHNYIHILPFDENALNFVRQADIVLVCSRMEAFGRVVLEGLLLQKPVIATNTGGILEMITDGETGLLYTPGNYIQLADQIEKLVNDPYLRNNLSQKGFQFASQTFTQERFVDSISRLITYVNTTNYKEKNGVRDFLKDQLINTITYKIKQENQLKEKISELEQNILDRDREIQAKEQEVRYYSLSKSWKFTRPLRKVMKFFRDN